jgi:hypothetical protein
MKINNNVFMSYLHCRYKACLLLEGKSGQPTNHQALIAEVDSAYKGLAQTALSHRYASVNAGSDCTDNQPLITFEAKIVLDSFEFVIDALKKEPDGSGGEASSFVALTAPSRRCA